MKFHPNVRALTLAACAALFPAAGARAQVSVQFHFGEDEYHRIDSHHPLRGRQYQTMATLAHTLDEVAQDLNREAYRGSRGDRSQVRLLASVSDFARRTSDFHQRMDGYLDSPWDMRREVDDLAKRARRVNQSVVNARLFPHTYDLWNSAVDVLSRMQQVLRGADVQLPPPYVRRGGEGHGAWDHLDADRNGNGVPDRLEGRPSPRSERTSEAVPFAQAGPRPSNIPELRRLGRELEERVLATRDALPRNDRDARSPEPIDRFSGDARQLRQRLDADVLDARELSEITTRLLDDARRQGNELRRERAYPGEQESWQRIIEILTRMQSLL